MQILHIMLECKNMHLLLHRIIQNMPIRVRYCMERILMPKHKEFHFLKKYMILILYIHRIFCQNQHFMVHCTHYFPECGVRKKIIFAHTQNWLIFKKGKTQHHFIFMVLAIQNLHFYKMQDFFGNINMDTHMGDICCGIM